MPMALHGTASMKICVSLESWMPRRRASCTMGRLVGTPPERHSTSARLSSSSGCPPSAHWIGRSFMLYMEAPSWTAGSLSLSVTRAPCPTSQRARANPCRATPRITTRLPVQLVAIGLHLLFHQLTDLPIYSLFTIHYSLRFSHQRQPHADHRCHQPDQPEALYHLRLAPAQQLEMQVDGSHLEEALPMRGPEVKDLDHHAHHLAQRDDGDDRQHHPLARHQRHDCQRRAESQRAHIAHDQLRRVY